jgi:hypothetical protein
MRVLDRKEVGSRVSPARLFHRAPAGIQRAIWRRPLTFRQPLALRVCSGAASTRSAPRVVSRASVPRDPTLGKPLRSGRTNYHQRRWSSPRPPDRKPERSSFLFRRWPGPITQLGSPRSALLARSCERSISQLWASHRGRRPTRRWWQRQPKAHQNQPRSYHSSLIVMT